MSDALRMLRERVARLDGEPIYADRHGRLDPDLAHVVRTMQGVTPPGVVRDTGRLPVTAPATADRIVDDCRLLRRLAARMPEVVVGPIRRHNQFWVASGRPANLPAGSHDLARSHFVEPIAAAEPSTKPFGVGLYTSTGVLGGYGMWWTFLDLNRGSTLTPQPWSVWSLSASDSAKVMEIGSAADWVQLVAAYPLHRNGLLYPDWARVASDWDGVHMTLRAIVATQGIWFRADERVAAAPYWDVESTLWLRWVFGAELLVHVELEG